MTLDVNGLCPLVQVFDMRTALAFYRDVLGFEIVSQSPGGDDCDWAWLRLGPADLMLNTAYEAEHRPPAPDPARVEAHADTALFFGARDVDAVCATLRARGLDLADPVTAPYGMRQLYLKDPDGYSLCFQHPAG